MKNKILPIVLALLLVIALAGNVVLFNKLVKARENSNDYQEAMSQLVILKTDLDNANETITTLQNEITDMENVISTNKINEEITAEMLEGLSVELTEEQQAANEAAKNPDNNSNKGNNGNNSSQQQQPPQQTDPDFDALWEEMLKQDGVTNTLPPLTEPEHEFGYDYGLNGGRAQ